MTIRDPPLRGGPGSSNDLARRFKQYFEKNALFNNKDTGILLPMIEKEELKAFTLKVTVIPSSYPRYSHAFLEQYYLLNKEYNLNTHRIVNFRVSQGFNIYLYDKDCKILYYSNNSLNAFWPGGRHYVWPVRRPGRGGPTRHVPDAGAGVSARRVVCVFCGPVESQVPLA